MRTLKMSISGTGLSLEACLDLPDNPGRYPGVVLCHPHPLYGGNMDNNIIMAVSRALTGAGMAGLRFNFRGVGLSGGSFDGVAGEKDDARSALSFLTLQEEVDPARIGVAGYSFGGMVALPVGGQSSLVKAIAAVSPVIPSGVLKDCAIPKYIVCGENDSIIAPSTVRQKASAMADPKTVEVIPGADHFWWGYEDLIAGKVAGFFARVLAGD